MADENKKTESTETKAGSPIKIKFRSTPEMFSYHAKPDWLDGDVRFVEGHEATRLLETFPKNFTKSDEKPTAPRSPEATVLAQAKNDAKEIGRDKVQ